MRTRMFALSLTAAVTLAAPAAAQQVALEPGQRVLLVLTPQRDVEGFTPGQELRGTLTEATADSLTLRLHPGAGPVRVARSAVRRTYVSRGVPSRARSAVLFATGGAAVGALYGAMYEPRQHSAVFSNRSDAQGALIGAGLGAAGGVVVGALYPRERWTRVRAPRNVALAPAIGSDARGVAVNIGF